MNNKPLHSVLLYILCLCPLLILGQNESKSDNHKDHKTSDLYVELREQARKAQRDNVNLKEERILLQTALKLAKEEETTSHIASTQKALGINFLNVALYDSSHFYFDQAHANYNIVGDTIQLLLLEEYVANVYQQQNRIPEALSTYYSLILKNEALNTFDGIYNSRVLRYNTAYILLLQEDYQKALDYLKPCFDDITYLNPSDEQLTQMEDLSVNYNLQIAQAYDGINQRDTARAYYNKTIEISKKIKWPYTEADAYLGLGKYEVDISHNYKKANEYAKKAYSIFESLEDEKSGFISSLNLLSHINWHLKKYAQAQSYAEQALLIAEDIDQYEGIREGHQNLSKISVEQGDYKHAFEHYVEAESAKDSIISLARDKIVQDLKAKYDADIKDLEIKQNEKDLQSAARQNDLMRLLFIIGALGIIALAYFILTRQKLGQAKKAAEYEKSISNALNKFVPRSFLKTLGYENILDVKLGDQIEQEVSIVFTDIRSFTTLSENLTPSDNFKFVKRYAEKMGPIIVKNGGFINQYLGDGIMAIFQSSPQDALNACIEMQRAVEQFNQNKDQLPNGNTITVGMGIHTGPLVMGIIGDETRQDAAVISDTVNTASRLEGLTKSYGTPILLSEIPYSKLENRNLHNFRYLGKSEVKGKAEALKIYECINGRTISGQEEITESKPLFESAVRSFEEENYEDSKLKFEKLSRTNKTDISIALYLEKLSQLKL